MGDLGLGSRIIRAFAVRFPGSQSESVRRFFDRLGELEKKAATVRFAERFPGRIDGVGELSAAEANELDLLRKARRFISSLSTEVQRITASTLSPDEKRKRIDGLYREILQEAQEALKSASSLRTSKKPPTQEPPAQLPASFFR